MYGLLLESNNKYIKDRVPGRAWANAKHVWEEGAGKQQNEDASKSSIEYKAKSVTRKGEY